MSIVVTFEQAMHIAQKDKIKVICGIPLRGEFMERMSENGE